MKIQIKKIVLFFLGMVIFVSCSSESGDEVEAKVDQIKELHGNLPNKFNLVTKTPNKYHEFVFRTENVLGYTSLQGNPLKEHSVYLKNTLSDKTAKGRVSINSKQVFGGDKMSKVPHVDISSIYGKNISFQISSGPNSTFKDGSTSKDMDMYVPNLVEITNPPIKTEEDFFPHCYYDDFVIEWNADENNNEGLMVIAEYVGISGVPDKDVPVHIMNADFIENDNGRAVLNNDIWEGIPDTGIVYITLLRGNIEIAEIDGEFYKFFAESHSVVPIILIKDLSTIEGF